MAKNVVIIVLLVFCAGLSFLLLQQSDDPRPGSLPAVIAGSAPGGEIELTLREDYLDRQIQERIGASAGSASWRDSRLDLRPGNEAEIKGSTTVVGVPIPITVQLALGVERGLIQAIVTDGQAGPIDLPETVRREIEAEVNDAIAGAFRLEGTGLELSGLRTDDTSVTLNLRQRGR